MDLNDVVEVCGHPHRRRKVWKILVSTPAVPFSRVRVKVMGRAVVGLPLLPNYMRDVSLFAQVVPLNAAGSQAPRLRTRISKETIKLCDLHKLARC